MSLCARFSDMSLRAPSEETAAPGGDEPRVLCSVRVEVLRGPDARGRCLVSDGYDDGKAMVPLHLLFGHVERGYEVTYEFWGTVDSADDSIVHDGTGRQFYK